MSTRKVQCKVCLKFFSNNQCLNRHKILHSDNPKPFKCEQCPRTFSRRDNLTGHMKNVHELTTSSTPPTHNISKTYGYQMTFKKVPGKTNDEDVDDMIALPDSSSKSSDVNYHKVFVCKFCNKIFSLRKYMMRHVRRIHRDRDKSNFNKTLNSTIDFVSNDESEDVEPQPKKPIPDDNGKKSTSSVFLLTISVKSFINKDTQN